MPTTIFKTSLHWRHNGGASLAERVERSLVDDEPIERVAVEKLFWPNPAQDYINLADGVSKVAVYDLRGALMQVAEAPVQTLSIDGLDAGIYLLQVTVNGKVYNHRLVIK